MTHWRILIALGVVLLVAAASLGSWVAGFFAGATYASTREAQTDAMVTASALVRLRDGRVDEATRLLETDLRGDFVSHWGGFRFEDSAPEIWVFRRLNLGGLAYAAAYLADHPDLDDHGDPERDELVEFVERIVACFRAPGLPDPRKEMLAHRKAIRECYAAIR
jgi:hypothetical protein